MKPRPIQYFSDEYLNHSKAMTPIEILSFIQDFQILLHHSKKQKSKLISVRVPEVILTTFRKKAELENIPYQTQIIRCMKNWLGFTD